MLECRKAHKAAGPDEIEPPMHKELAVTIAPILTAIYRKSYETVETPDDWNKFVHLKRNQCVSKECKYYRRFDFIKRMKIHDAKLIVYMSLCQLQTLPTLAHPTSTLAALIKTM